MKNDVTIEECLKYIDSLEEQNKMLRKAQKNTIHIGVEFDHNMYEVDTQIQNKLTELKDYWLADDYKNPTKVRFIQYGIGTGIGCINIYCSCKNYETGEIEGYYPSSLYPTKNKASDAYLAKKGGK